VIKEPMFSPSLSVSNSKETSGAEFEMVFRMCSLDYS
jgi:hypothetical protein